MSKKRVHEIAKELKDNHGIELDNKAVVTELQSLGYDVKSHSSSLEDDQAVAAVQRIVDKRKPKAAPPPVAPKGFVVRRKVGESTVQTAVAPPTGGPLISKPVGMPPPVAETENVAATAAVETAPPVEAAPATATANMNVNVNVNAASAVVAPPVEPPAPVAVAAVAAAPVTAPGAGGPGRRGGAGRGRSGARGGRFGSARSAVGGAHVGAPRRQRRWRLPGGGASHGSPRHRCAGLGSRPGVTVRRKSAAPRRERPPRAWPRPAGLPSRSCRPRRKPLWSAGRSLRSSA